MKKVLLTMLTLLAAGGMWAQTAGVNVPTVKRTAGEVKEVSVVASKTGVIKIQLEGTTAYRDLQFDLTLPEGISLKTPAGDAVVKDVDNMVDENHVVFYAQDGQTVKFAVVDNVVDLDETTGVGAVENADNYAKTLAPESIIFNIPITVDAAYSGSNVATLANVVASTEETDGVKSNELADATFNIRAMLLGDVTDDGKVDMADAQAITFNFLGQTPAVFVEEVGDIEENSAVDIADANRIVFNVLDASAKSFVVEDDVIECELDPE